MMYICHSLYLIFIIILLIYILFQLYFPCLFSIQLISFSVISYSSKKILLLIVTLIHSLFNTCLYLVDILNSFIMLTIEVVAFYYFLYFSIIIPFKHLGKCFSLVCIHYFSSFIANIFHWIQINFFILFINSCVYLFSFLLLRCFEKGVFPDASGVFFCSTIMLQINPFAETIFVTEIWIL